MRTPIFKLGLCYDNYIYVKREDMQPFSFGGNKYRIAENIFCDMLKNGCDCIIGYGNARSNMCRVLANMAYSKGYPCYIISPSDDDGSIIDTANSRLVFDCNAEIVYCDKTEVKQVVEYVIEKCKSKGLTPYYIYGDSTGRGNEKILSKAYIDVFNEIISQEIDMGLEFDYLFLAAGTGMTYSGLAIGKIMSHSKIKIVGISVSRDKDMCKKVLLNYFDASNIQYNLNDEIIRFEDEYLCGGYGKYSSEIENIIMSSMTKFGMPLDPTYTGKAFYGMTEYIRKNKIKDKKILFLHTGGTPLFFDYYKEKK